MFMERTEIFSRIEDVRHYVRLFVLPSLTLEANDPSS